MKKILIIGATSEIAYQTAVCFAHDKAGLFLAARNHDRCKELAEKLKTHGASSVDTAFFDAEDRASHSEMIAKAEEALGRFDVVLIAHGWMPDESECFKDYDVAEKSFRVNFLSVVSIVTELAKILQKQESGVLAVISSVAGDRGRAKLTHYGAAKAALGAYLSGLRGQLLNDNVHVLTVKPGFVITPMTADLKKGALAADAEKVGRDIASAINARKNVIYTPSIWRLIMLFIKAIPESIFKHLKF